MGIKKLIKKAAKKAIEKNGRAKIKLEKVKFSELRLAIENYNRKNDRSIDDIIFVDDEFVLVLEDQREDDSEDDSEDEAVTPEPVAKNITENKVADNVEVYNVNEDLKLRLAIENYNRKNDRSIDDIIFADNEFVLVLEDQREDDSEDDSEDEAVTPEPVAKNITENKVADNVEACNVNEDLKRSEKSKRNRKRKRR